MNQNDISQLFYDGSTAPMNGTPIIMLIEGNGCAWAGKFFDGQWHISMAVATPSEGIRYSPEAPGFTRSADFRPSHWRPEGFVKPLQSDEKSQ